MVKKKIKTYNYAVVVWKGEDIIHTELLQFPIVKPDKDVLNTYIHQYKEVYPGANVTVNPASYSMRTYAMPDQDFIDHATPVDDTNEKED